jgi:hypothetical protein
MLPLYRGIIEVDPGRTLSYDVTDDQLDSSGPIGVAKG